MVQDINNFLLMLLVTGKSIKRKIIRKLQADMETVKKSVTEGLNEAQKRAVECVEGPVLIVAGAGSGKTRVLTCRIANILSQGCPGERILALTFTKKAAGEMKERIALMVGGKTARHVVMGTFHSVFIRFLRDYADRLGYSRDFTIYDTSDSVSAVKACIKELGLDDSVYKAKDVLSRISMAKNNLITADRYRANQNIIISDTKSKKPRICDVYSLYVDKCRRASVMDFDDILVNMNILLRDHPDALEEIASRFSHIMVDEYQDTNFSQYLIVRKLAAGHRNICVVGDDSQSIYAFRGAKIENILNFKKDYPDCRIFRLEENYRSTQTIVCAANSLIAKNEGRIPKECFSRGDKGEAVRYTRAYNETDEAMKIVWSLKDRMRAESARYQDFAILYRTNSQSRSIEEALRRHNIPYMVYSGNSFFERAEVKDMMAYFKLVCNPRDDESFKRVVNKPARGIGDTSLGALEKAALAAGTSLFKAVYRDDLEQFGLRSAGVEKLRAFCDMVNALACAAPSSDAHEMALKVADKSGLYAAYKADTSIEGLARLSNLDELLGSVLQFVEDRQNEIIEELADDGGPVEDASALPAVTLADFLENVSLLSNADTGEGDEDSSNKVALMTVHSAKGLEFPYVFIAGMEENIFPSGGMMILPTEVEEERRLFYVALTRAKKAVEICFAENRLRNGRHESNSPSRFLKEIDPQYVDNPLTEDDFVSEGAAPSFGGFGSKFNVSGGGQRYSGGRTSRPSGGEGRSWSGERCSGQRLDPNIARYGGSGEVRRFQSSGSAVRPLPTARPIAAPDPDFVPTPPQELRTGMTVMHNRFGRGVIEEMSGSFPDVKARINFEESGIKIIMLKYAKLKKI